MDATPGLLEFGNEFYSVAGAEGSPRSCPRSRGGRAVIGVAARRSSARPRPARRRCCCTTIWSCAACARTVEISFTIPLPTPVPPSPDTSRALEHAFAERDIAFMASTRVAALDGERGAVLLDGGGELPYDLFLGVPKHRAPDVVPTAVSPRTATCRRADHAAHAL